SIRSHRQRPVGNQGRGQLRPPASQLPLALCWVAANAFALSRRTKQRLSGGLPELIRRYRANADPFLVAGWINQLYTDAQASSGFGVKVLGAHGLPAGNKKPPEGGLLKVATQWITRFSARHLLSCF